MLFLHVVSHLPHGLIRSRLRCQPAAPISQEDHAMLPQVTTTAAGVLGDLPWGTHFCYFFESAQDLFDTVVPFVQAGLENHEFCLWSIYAPITEADALRALRESISGLDRYLAEGAIEILTHPQPLFDGDVLKAHSIVGYLREKLDDALARGYTGMRVAGSPTCMQKGNTDHFREFEREVGRSVANRPIIALCCFAHSESTAAEILDAARMHQFVATRRRGDWEILDASQIKPPKAEVPGHNQQPSAGLHATHLWIGSGASSSWSLSKMTGVLAGTLAILLGAAVLVGWAVHSTFLA